MDIEYDHKKNIELKSENETNKMKIEMEITENSNMKRKSNKYDSPENKQNAQVSRRTKQKVKQQ